MLYRYIGLLSALVFILGDIPYVLDTFKGKTKPHRVTWGIVTLLNAIGFANQYAYGASNSLWLFGAGTLMTGVIFIGSLRNGVGGKSRADVACLAIGLAGIVLWFAFRSPLYSVLANIIADAAALWPSFAKAKRDPNSETRIAWLVGTIAVVLSAVSVGSINWRLLLLPVASAIMQGYMVYLLYIRAVAMPVKTSGPSSSAPAVS